MASSPIDLPARLASRVVDDLRDALSVGPDLLRLASRGAELLESLNDRAEQALVVAERLDARAEAILEFGERIDRRAEAILQMGERIDERAEKILSTGAGILELGERIDERALAILGLGENIEMRGAKLDERAGALLETAETFNELGENMLVEARLVHTRAAEVVAQAEEMMRAIPTAERAVELIQPLEGAVERLGRMVDRLPGGRGRNAG